VREQGEAAAKEPSKERKSRGRPPTEGRAEAILDAALEVFAANGFAAARLDEVAERAGVGKGTLYLYFESKEALFEGVIRHWVVPQIQRFEDRAEAGESSAEELIRDLIGTIYREFVGTRLRHILRLIIAEGERFPHLAEFYYANVLRRGMLALRRAVELGVARGEFRATSVVDFPQAIAGPAVLAGIWKILFDAVSPLELEGLREAHLDLVMNGLKGRGDSGPPG
jgi:AcrR family transcriptional regulator